MCPQAHVCVCGATLNEHFGPSAICTARFDKHFWPNRETFDRFPQQYQESKVYIEEPPNGRLPRTWTQEES